FPDAYDIYDFMSAVDGLITDYSSIMYDFASQNKKIILFNYDYDEYLSSRGMYENINDYPFYITDKINELVDYINKEDTVEYSSFTDKYCS
ncbi:CDP-glycerol glycerophosphotransferase family protein, partial [Staphylococcus epidermidis]